VLHSGFLFKKYQKKKQTPFERLFEIFKELDVMMISD